MAHELTRLTELLDAITTRPGQTQAQLCRACALPPSVMPDLLGQLVAAGQVRLGPGGSVWPAHSSSQRTRPFSDLEVVTPSGVYLQPPVF